MDILKQELLKKRQSLSEETGSRKVFNRSKIEQKRFQQLREEEKRDAEAKHLSQNQQQKPKPKLDSLNLPKQEVIRRLRLLKQPVTLFGESDNNRLDRLNYVLQAGLFELDGNEMTEGQTNDFLRDIVELKRRQKCGILSEQKRSETDGGGEDGSYKRIKADFCELSDEDKIVMFFKKVLIEWNQELDEMAEAEKRISKGKAAFATFKQCARYLNPLFKFCRKKVLHDDIRQALVLVVNCCMKGDYSAAKDHYIRIAIGNSAWPIGVTMVGIHERSAREKIYTNSVAHVMNNETTRKYLTSVKRLITFCEKHHPTMP